MWDIKRLISPSLSPTQDLIRRLLTVDPKRRLTAAQAVTHPWLLSKDADLLNHNLGVNLEQLKLFNARRKLRAAIKSVSVGRPALYDGWVLHTPITILTAWTNIFGSIWTHHRGRNATTSVV